MRVARWLRWCFAGIGAVAAASCARAASRDDFMPGSQAGTGSESGSNQGPGLVIDGDAGGSLLVQPMVGSSVCSSVRTCDPTCTDFPATPILDSTPQNGAAPTPQDAASHFQAAATAAGGPCIVEPGDGALLPNNWVRPRFRFLPVDPKETLFEIRIATPRQQNDLVVYTTSNTWT